jgi:hypothetical protein
MKVSFDGSRRNLHNDMMRLRDGIEELEEESICLEDLKELYNEVAASVGTLNCIYSDDVEGDFNDLSDLGTLFLEEETEEEAA